MFVSLAHSDHDIDRTVEAVGDFSVIAGPTNTDFPTAVAGAGATSTQKSSWS
jgi:hypothetical protein